MTSVPSGLPYRQHRRDAMRPSTKSFLEPVRRLEIGPFRGRRKTPPHFGRGTGPTHTCRTPLAVGAERNVGLNCHPFGEHMHVTTSTNAAKAKNWILNHTGRAAKCSEKTGSKTGLSHQICNCQVPPKKHRVSRNRGNWGQSKIIIMRELVICTTAVLRSGLTASRTRKKLRVCFE